MGILALLSRLQIKGIGFQIKEGSGKKLKKR